MSVLLQAGRGAGRPITASLKPAASGTRRWRPCWPRPLARSADRRRARAAIAALERRRSARTRSTRRHSCTEIRDTLQRSRRDASGQAAAPLLNRLAAWFASTFPDEQETVARARHARPSSSAAGLAAVNGVGPATADAILLALGRPAYPVDRGTYRDPRPPRLDRFVGRLRRGQRTALLRLAGRRPRRDRPAVELAGPSGPPVLRPEIAEVRAMPPAGACFPRNGRSIRKADHSSLGTPLREAIAP